MFGFLLQLADIYFDTGIVIILAGGAVGLIRGRTWLEVLTEDGQACGLKPLASSGLYDVVRHIVLILLLWPLLLLTFFKN